MPPRKRHKRVAVEVDEDDVRVERLVTALDAASESDSELSEQEGEEDSESETAAEEEEEEQEVLTVTEICAESASPAAAEADAGPDNQAGVYHFPAGDIGLKRLLQYRLRPPLEQMHYNNKQEFHFQLHDVDYQSGWKLFLRMYGVTPNGYSVTLNVHGFEPYFAVRWPLGPDSQHDIQHFIQLLNSGLEREARGGPAVTRYRLEPGLDTRGYHEQPLLFLILYMKQPHLVGKARRLIESSDWDYADYVCDTYESDIDFVLRYLCDQNFSGEITLRIAAGQYYFRNMLQSQYNSDLEIEVRDYRSISRCPQQIAVSPKVTVSFDAEMKVLVKGDFPVASRDPIINIAAYSVFEGSEVQTRTLSISFSLGSSYSIRGRHPGAYVHCHETEEDLLLAFRMFMMIQDPDIWTGYNILDFDLTYFLERAELLKHGDSRLEQFAYLGRIKQRKSVVKDESKSDRAHGFRQNKKINLEGRDLMDMLLIMIKRFKLRSYKLNSVCQLYLNSQKEEMSYELIPEKHGSVEGRTELNSYCYLDAKLPKDLMDKLRILLTDIQEAHVTGIMLRHLHERGMGFRGKSNVYRLFQRQTPRVFVYVRTEEQRKRDSLNPPYPGAHVEAPVKGYHTHPIATLDFSSLYPSIIIACNMCVTTFITVAYARKRGWKRASLHGDGSDGDYFQIPAMGNDAKAEQLERLFTSGQSLDGLLCDGDPCFVTKKHRKGVIPIILEGYLAERKSVKRAMAEHGELKERLREYATDMIKSREELLQQLDLYEVVCKRVEGELQTPRPDKLKLERELARLRWKIEKLRERVQVETDTRKQEAKEALSQAETEEFLEILKNLLQLQIKVCGNSMYGLFGAPTSFLYFVQIAAAVTSMGRYMILVSKLEVEKKYTQANGYPIDAKVVYGDSVSSSTPILMRLNQQQILFRCIADLPRQSDWIPHIAGKECATPAYGLEVWTDQGFTAVKQIIRHKTEKKVVRVTAHTGSVTVTEDHSLLRPNGNCVTPSQLSLGEELLTAQLPVQQLMQNTQQHYPLAWVWGLFFADGSCGQYECASGSKSTWAINKLDRSLLEKAQTLLQRIHPSFQFPILDTVQSSGVYKLQLRAAKQGYGTVVDWVKEWRSMFYCERTRTKQVPDILWQADRESRVAFLEGYYAGDGDKTGRGKRFDVKGEIGAAGLYFLANSLGYSVSLNTRSDKLDIYRLTLTTSKQRKAAGVVKSISAPAPAYSTDDSSCYVFDLETENHHFAAGVGSLVVHNTDSIFVKMIGLTLEQARVLSLEMGVFASKLWPPPHKLEAEKIYNPTLLMMKKKRAGLKYEMDPETGGFKPPKVEASGVESVRRDNCRFATDVQDGILDKLFKNCEDGRGVERAIDYIQQQVALLLQGQVSFYKLIISKQLRKDKYSVRTVHSELAARRGIKAGNRVDYVLVQQHYGAKQFECGENPETAFRNGIPVDWERYLTKQIMQPVIRVFAPILTPQLDISVKGQQKAVQRAVIRRIFTGPHMNQRIVSVNHEKIRARGVFSLTPTCLGCKTALKQSENKYCERCKKEKGEQLLEGLHQQLEQLSLQSCAQWRQCQSCLGNSTSSSIACEQTDCENYWNRKLTRKQAEHVSEQLLCLNW